MIGASLGSMPSRDGCSTFTAFAARNRPKESVEHASLQRLGELGIVDQVFLRGDFGEQVRREDDRDLAIDDRGVERAVGRDGFRAENVLLARVEQDLRGGRVDGRRIETQRAGEQDARPS